MHEGGWKRPLLYMLGYAVGGPLVGYVVFMWPSGLNGLLGMVVLAFFGLPILAAYVFGAVPAALTGLVAGWSLRWGKAWLFLLVSTIAGAGFTVAWGREISDFSWSIYDYALNAKLGGASGLVCGLLGLRGNGFELKLPAFVQNWKAGDVLLVVLVAIMLMIAGTLLLPVLPFAGAK